MPSDEPLPTEPDPELVKYVELGGGGFSLPWALLLVAALAIAKALS